MKIRAVLPIFLGVSLILSSVLGVAQWSASPSGPNGSGEYSGDRRSVDEWPLLEEFQKVPEAEAERDPAAADRQRGMNVGRRLFDHYYGDELKKRFLTNSNWARTMLAELDLYSGPAAGGLGGNQVKSDWAFEFLLNPFKKSTGVAYRGAVSAEMNYEFDEERIDLGLNYKW